MRPLVFYTQSLGPFLNPKNKNTLKKIFNKSLLILLRDELSLKHLRDIGVNENKIHISSDIVFSSKSQIKSINIQKSNNDSAASRLKIAISVRFWQQFKKVSVELGINNFRSVMCAATQYLVEKHNAEITYLSTCQGIPEYWTDDANFASEIYNQLPNAIQKQVNINTSFHHPQTLLEKLANYDLVIGTRMHMCILSLAAGTPVLPIAYEFKTKELFARLGMSAWVQDIETINQEFLINSIEEFLASLPNIKSDVMVQVKKERDRAVESSFLVKQMLEKWN